MKKNKVRVLKEYGSQLDERIQALHQELQDSIVDNKRLWQEAEKDERNQANTREMIRLK